jgi:hypothetical protein
MGAIHSLAAISTITAAKLIWNDGPVTASGLEQHDRHRRHAEGTQRQCAPPQQNAQRDQHRHGKAAQHRYLGPGQQHISEADEKAGWSSQYFAVAAQCKPGHQGKQEPRSSEGQPHDDGDVKAGDR